MSLAIDAADPLPAYTELDEDGLKAWVESLVERADELGLPLTRPSYNRDITWIKQDGVTTSYVRRRGPAPANKDSDKAVEKLMLQKRIIETFFRLVRTGQTGGVALFVQKGLVSPDVTDGEGAEDGYGGQYLDDDEPDDGANGATPLLVAVDAGDAAMVRVLANLGADPNRLARPPGLRSLTFPRFHRRRDDPLVEGVVRRTPLMLAAAQGRVALVKLFLDELHADDALVAPDGQIALRLAAEAGHREIVDLLPARRAGAWTRVKTRHSRAMRRVKRAARKIGTFAWWTGRIALWELPKFLLWTTPKELVVLPLVRGVKYLRTHWREALRRVWEGLKKLPRAAWHFLRDLVKAIGEMVVELGKVLVRMVRRIPAALKIAGQWLLETLKTVGRALADVGRSIVSALHTALTAIVTFFRTVTLKDVWNGVCIAFRAVFVGLPQAAWNAVKLVGKFLLDFMEGLFGCLGVIAYWLGFAVVWVVTYIPKQLWKILAAFGSSIAAGFHEVMVWFDPKH